MARRNRITLQKYFARGKMPTEDHFTDLIDSMLNIIDEGFDKSSEKGLSLAPLDEAGHIISIFQKIEDEQQKWAVTLDKTTGNLIIRKYDDAHVFSISQNGHTGFGTIDPQYQIHTSKTIGIYGRAGTYVAGEVPADGQWHNITETLKGCFAFEVIAGAGKPGEGKYALFVATAIQCFGAHKRIYKKQSWYGIRCNKIKLRWKKEENDCILQIKTRCNYGSEMKISYNVSSLWDNHRMTHVKTEDTLDEQ